ncbi:MAG: DEAD/DEAH box helicase family protein [bacterium]|nr:DEAD/DEAH box helicase family protein [bacterium]
MIPLKEYQHRTLNAFSRWLSALEDARAESQRRVEALESARLEPSAADRNFPELAWKRLVEAGGVESGAPLHVDRSDGAGRPIPHVCFKIPTGGGKTLLGAAALERLGMQTGLVLWVVPTRAIYAQTKGAHLEGNADTRYKMKVFAQLEAALNDSATYECGEVSLHNGATEARFKIVFREESFAEVV